MARPKPLADLIGACVGPAFAAQGFARPTFFPYGPASSGRGWPTPASR